MNTTIIISVLAATAVTEFLFLIYTTGRVRRLEDALFEGAVLLEAAAETIAMLATLLKKKKEVKTDAEE